MEMCLLTAAGQNCRIWLCSYVIQGVNKLTKKKIYWETSGAAEHDN